MPARKYRLLVENPDVLPAEDVNSVRVRVRAQSNVNLASPGATIDGATMAADQEFLADQQSTPTEDGVYVWNSASTPATRSLKMPAGTKVGGMMVSIKEGTDGNKVFVITNDETADIVGTNGLSVAASSSAGGTTSADGTGAVTGASAAGSTTGKKVVCFAGAFLPAPGTNAHAQFDGLSAIDATTGITKFLPGRTYKIAWGAGCVACTIRLTITGVNGGTFTETFAVPGGGGGEVTGGTVAGIIARIESVDGDGNPIAPADTIDVRTDTGFSVGEACASLDVLTVDGAEESVGAGNVPSGTVLPTTAPNGTHRYVVEYTIATHTHGAGTYAGPSHTHTV